MCCILTVIAFLGPRAGILVWWLLRPDRWDEAFSTFIWPVLGFLVAPFTTLMYVTVSYQGVEGLDWLWVGLAAFVDLSVFAGGGYGNRGRMPAYASS